MKKITILAAFVMALFVLAGCQASVNTLENADKHATPNLVNDVRFVTDGFLRDRLVLQSVKMSPSAGDPMQQKIMKFMPLLFFLFCYTYPSALALYWTTTNIISIIQTLIIRRLPQPTLEEVKPDAKGGNKKEGFFARIQRMAEEQQKALDAQKRQNNMRNVTKKKK